MKNAIWLTGYQVLDELNEDGVQRFLVECMTFVDSCSKCGVVGRLYKHGTEQPAFRDIPSFGRQLIIDVKLQRYRCRDCGGTTNQPLLGMDTQRRMTERCVAWIAKRGVTETFSAVRCATEPVGRPLAPVVAIRGVGSGSCADAPTASPRLRKWRLTGSPPTIRS